MALLGTHRTVTTGISPGHRPTATMSKTGLGPKLRLDLGNEVLLISLTGPDPTDDLVALRHDLQVILGEKEAA